MNTTATRRVRTIGITGFTHGRDIEIVQQRFRREMGGHALSIARSDTDLRLMIGFLVSHHSMIGFTSSRYPWLGSLRELIETVDPSVADSLIHFNTPQPKVLVHDALILNNLLRKQFYGFQSNLEWPEPSSLMQIRCMLPKSHIVLQIKLAQLLSSDRPPHTMDTAQDDLVNRLRHYADIINAVLLDPSEGRGILLDVAGMVPIVRAITRELPHLGIGVAGGLNPDNLNILAPLVRVCPYLSIDCESGAREPASDEFSTFRAGAYLKAAFDLFYPA